MQKQSILFVYVNYSSFVKADFKILSGFAKVKRYQFKPGKGIFNTGVELFKELIYLMFKGFKYNTIFIWFGDYHSLLPVLFARLFGKKSCVVIGGYDVSTLPEYHYGALCHPLRSFFTRNTFKYAGICLPVAEALHKKLKLIDPDARAETIPTRVDSTNFNFSEYNRSKTVMTISGTDNFQRLMVKGLDRFRDLATYLPEFEFIIIGTTESVKTCFEPLPANLILLPPQDFDQLGQYYQRASIYAQLSRSEGLPNALCEAMLCGCIPVGTNVGDIGITIGSAGLTVENWNPELMAEFIRANHNNIQLRDMAREQVITLYDNGRRAERFRQLIDNPVKA